MLERVPSALLVGVISFLISLVVIFLVSALLPGISINASFYAAVIGVLAAIVYLVSGKTFLK